MPKLLICSSTTLELEPFFRFCQFNVNAPGAIEPVTPKIDVLITGIGIAQSAFRFAQIPKQHYQYLIQAGIAGSFSSHLPIGSVCQVTSDQFSEMGADAPEGFIPAKDLSLGIDNVFFLQAPSHFPELKFYKAKGITVNTVSGLPKAIQQCQEQFNPDVETMEGASFAMACKYLNYNGIQLRAISNRIEARNTKNWNIPLAVKNLNTALLDFLKSHHWI